MARQDKTRQDKTRQEVNCINLYLSNGKETSYQNRIYDIDYIMTALTAGYRNLILLEAEEMETEKNIIMLGMLDQGGQEQTRRGYKPDGIAPTLNTMQGGERQPKILIKANTNQGFTEIEPPAVADLSFSKSTASRGRTQDGGKTCPTIDTSATGLTVFENQYRIRKLTPRECWRLMGFSDEDFNKAESVNSNTQLYKQAGNSIVVDVLEAIFNNLF